jgi:AbrB family looped-hinge helix DNA binding protein
MSIATVTSKGQVTIPVDVRRALGIEAGARVEFVPRPDGSYEFSALTGSVSALSGIIPWSGRALTLDEMNAAIAASAAETMSP